MIPRATAIHPGLCFSLLFLFTAVRGENWPHWRGPRANGISLEENLPETWSETTNVRWKRSLKVRGNSTPIVWGSRLLLTGQVGDSPIEMRGRTAAPLGSEEPPHFLVQCLDKNSGDLIWERSLQASGELTPTHPKHNLASPSIVTDGELVYAWFGTGQLICLDMEGRLVWQRHLGKDYGPFQLLWAHGSSPVIYRGSLILVCDHAPGAYVIAVDGQSGRTLWKTDRGEGLRAYSTPLLVSLRDRDELIVNAQPGVDAYDPQTGSHLWSVSNPIRVPVPTPVFANDVIYLNRGYSSSPLMAILPGSRDRVAESRVKWSNPTGAPYVSSVLVYRGLLYMGTENGIVSALDPETGHTVWRERMGGNYSASPLGADGKVYFFNEDGEAVVLQAGSKFQLLSRIDMAAPILASPAVSDGRIYVRTTEDLWAVGYR